MKILRYTVLIVFVFLIFSCYWTPSGEDGALKLEFESSFVSKGTAPGTETDARVYLLSSNYTLHTFESGKVYYEADITGKEPIIIEKIPAEEWTILLALGEATGGVFETVRYGSSSPTQINPGGVDNPTTISVALKNSPVTPAISLFGKDFNAVVSIDSAVYASTGSTIYSGDTVGTLSVLSANLPGGRSINSLSVGKWFGSSTFSRELWVNTTQGILPYRGGQFVTNFYDAEVSVRDSLALYTAADPNITTSEASLAIFYKRQQGVGGTFIEEDVKNDPTQWSWTDVKELEGTLAPNQQLVLDFEVVGDYGFFASPLGAFQMKKDVFESGAGSNLSSVLADGVFFEIAGEGGKPVKILSLAYDENTGIFYIGTESGVYRSTLNSEFVPQNPIRISGTEDFGFTKIVVNDSYAAFVSEYDVFLQRKSDSLLKKLPFYAGLPGRLTSLAWKGGSNVLLVSGSGLDENGDDSLFGSGGLVSIDMNGIFTAP